MPDENTPQATAAAETTTGGDKPQTTATPSAPANAGTNPGPLGYAQAREILRSANSTIKTLDSDPLFMSDSDSADPLFSDKADSDPLAMGADEPSDEPEGETSPETTAETDTTTTEEAETESETDPESEEEEATEEDGTKKDSKRIRLRLDKMNPRDAAVVRLSHERGLSLDEARKELFGEAAPAKEQPAEEAAETEAAMPAIAEIEQTIQSLKAERRAAAQAMDTVKQVEIDEKLEDAKDQLLEAKAQARQVQEQTAAKNNTLKAESLKRVSAMYPEATKEGSPLFDAIGKYLEARPKSFFDDPEWRETAASTVAARMGITPVKAETKTEAAPAKVAPKATPAVPKRKATPVPAPAPGGSVNTPAQPSADQIRNQIAEAKAAGDFRKVSAIMKQLQPAA